MDPDRLETMAKLFGVALLLVGPFGFVRIRRTLREINARGSDPAGPANEPQPAPDTGPAAGTDGVDVADLVAAVERRGGDGDPPLVLVVPPDARVNGRPAPPGVAEAILDDAARRSGRAIEWSSDGADRVATVTG